MYLNNWITEKWNNFVPKTGLYYHSFFKDQAITVRNNIYSIFILYLFNAHWLYFSKKLLLGNLFRSCRICWRVEWKTRQEAKTEMIWVFVDIIRKNWHWCCCQSIYSGSVDPIVFCLHVCSRNSVTGHYCNWGLKRFSLQW
jgi:hypothetical protein